MGQGWDASLSEGTGQAAATIGGPSLTTCAPGGSLWPRREVVSPYVTQWVITDRLS